ncbi:MAG: hypothetical protein ACFB50_13425 [Rubrobacteraceae bacterium]
MEPTLTPVVFINSDEELGSRSSKRYVRYLAGVVDRAFVMEPSLGPRGRLKTARKGVGRYSVAVTGKAAHASHEFVYTEKLVERCALLAMLLMKPPQGVLSEDS